MRAIQSPKTMIAIGALALLGAGGYYASIKKETAPLFPQNLVFPEDTAPAAEVQNAHPVKPGSATVEGKAGTPAIPAATAPGTPGTPGIPNKLATPVRSGSISRQVAIQQAELGNYYKSIVSEVEGFFPKAYFDNKGIAIGNGWNIGQQSRQRNTEIGFGIEMDSQSVEAILPYSGVQKPTSLPQVAITPEQSSKAVELMRAQYEEPMKKLVPNWSKLKPNEQDALVYHAYKVGGGGAAKYTTMLSALKAYTAAPTEENKLKVASTFTYKYTLNGKEYQDSRSTLYLSALFTSPEAYRYLLGTSKAPQDFAKVASIAGQHIDTSKPAEAQIQDDYGQAREVLINKGVPYNTILLESSYQLPAVKPSSNTSSNSNRKRVYNHPSTIWFGI